MMTSGLINLFFKIEGRINRSEWWGWFILLVAGTIAVLFGLSAFSRILTVSAQLLGYIAWAVFLWCFVCLSAKRLHDTNASAWWMLIGLIPVIGGAVLLIWLGFRPGTNAGDLNDYGEPPPEYSGVSEHTFPISARSFIRAWGSAMLLAALGLVLWEILVRVLDVQTWILPPVSLILAELADKPDLFLRHASITAQEILIGFAVSMTFAGVMATAMFWSRLLERSVYPFLIASQTIPVFTLAPMLLIWIGTGIAPKIVVVVLFTFFPVTINLMTGLKSVDSDMVDMFRTLGASRWQMFTKLYIRSALPYLFAGLKVAAVVSVIGAVIGEWISAASGLGWLIKTSTPKFQTELVFAAIFTLSVMAALMFIAIALLQSRILRNYPGSNAQGGES